MKRGAVVVGAVALVALAIGGLELATAPGGAAIATPTRAAEAPRRPRPASRARAATPAPRPPRIRSTEPRVVRLADEVTGALRRFADEASLDDDQRVRLATDLAELADVQDEMWSDESLAALPPAERLELARDLGDQLEERAAAYLRPDQLRALRFRYVPWDLVAQVQRLQLADALRDGVLASND